jgi:centromere/kinetochore protein ZW10
MADISYLFEQGMLLDYKEEEIIKLLKALFADTPLRENTIRKVLRGHPVLA